MTLVASHVIQDAVSSNGIFNDGVNYAKVSMSPRFRNFDVWCDALNSKVISKTCVIPRRFIPRHKRWERH